MAVRSRAVNAAHTAGIFADMTLDGPEIGTLVAVVDRAKNLPNRKTMGKQDPYCAMRLGKEAKRTNTDKRGGQTPKWDQELRFTVHDSPDYYKLKCSVFNDDKKTDLIGEAWIDLREVIVRGGGQNDLWHQLNWKGKYAGDVRVELTYYDTRPLPETSSERRRQRDKSHSIASDAPSTASTSRQLGPREIKRRPLPPGPGDYSSPTSATQSPEPRPLEDVPNGMWTNRGHNTSHHQPRPPKQRIPETPDDVGSGLDSEYDQDPYDSPPPSQAMYQQRPPSDLCYDDFDRIDHQYSEPGSYHRTSYAPDGMRPAQNSLPLKTADSSSGAVSDRSNPDSPRNTPTQSPYHSSPLPRTPPHSSSSMPAQPHLWQNRSSVSPTKHAVYRDSPLRHSISHVDLPQTETSFPDPRFDEDEHPPAPPAHRDHVSGMTAVGASIPSPQTPRKYGSVDERSPLQKLEREHNPYQDSSPPPREYKQPHPPVQQYDPSMANNYNGYRFPADDRRGSHNDNMLQLRPTSSAKDAPLNEPAFDRGFSEQQYTGGPQQDFRQSASYGQARRARTFDTSFDAYDDCQARKSEPIVARPRAISPGLSQNIPRKSITPTPATPEGRNSIGVVPFSPDSYDVLNPGASPTVEGDPYATPEQLQEAARQREVDKLRDQGPIIGNDGRVIDPSDHLPVDTWAPEPERKNRMPEHVIRIRTKEEARLQHRGGSLPASARPLSMSSSITTLPNPGQTSPTPAAPNTSPAQPESAGGRNRLRKQMPTRPLPAQPYPHAQSSPAVMPAASNEDQSSPSGQRYTISSSPSTPGSKRASVSEYQIPASNECSPRGAPPFAEQYSTPPRAGSARPGFPVDRAGYGPDGSHAKSSSFGPGSSRDYRGYGAPEPLPQALLPRTGNSTEYGRYGVGDSLALELSTIDIGPSRTGRTALRPVRGYGAY